MVSSQPLSHSMAPPMETEAWLSSKTQFVIVGAPPAKRIDPPKFSIPFRNVKPVMRVPAARLPPKMCCPRPCASTVAQSGSPVALIRSTPDSM